MVLYLSFLFGIVSCEFVQVYVNLDMTFEEKIPINSTDKIAVETDNVIGCGVKCLQNSICESYFYHHDNSSCQLYGKRFSLDEVTDFGGAGWKYSTLETGDLGIPLNNNISCPFQQMFGVCFTVYPQPIRTTLSAVKANCTSQNAELIRIDSVEKQNYFAGVFGQITDDYLYAAIQGTYVGGGTWQYDDGTPFTYFNWIVGQPANSTSDQCIGMRKIYNFLWWDLDCSRTITAVVFGCEFKL